MGARSGGSGSGMGGGGGLARGATEAGYSAALARSVLNAEKGIKDNKNETAVIFDENGKEVFRKEGTRTGVSYPGKYGTDRIMTHNHPGPDAPFSSSDLRDAVKFNMKEMRAVSRNYTFSVKRPKGGWGDVNPESVMRTYGSIKRQVAKEWAPRFEKVSSGAPMRKEYFKSQIEVQNRLAKKYGWNFSYKKNS
jgi:hypothetical protein